MFCLSMSKNNIQVCQARDTMYLPGKIVVWNINLNKTIPSRSITRSLLTCFSSLSVSEEQSTLSNLSRTEIIIIGDLLHFQNKHYFWHWVQHCHCLNSLIIGNWIIVSIMQNLCAFCCISNECPYKLKDIIHRTLNLHLVVQPLRSLLS